MKNVFKLYHWPDEADEDTYGVQYSDMFNTVEDAIAVTEVERSKWFLNTTSGGYYVPLSDEERARTGRNQSWYIVPAREPETDADRIELAVHGALEYGQANSAHHKMWVIDQMLRILAGDRYEQLITKWREDERWPGTDEWDTGTAP